MCILAPCGEWVAQCVIRLRRTSLRAGSVTDCVARPLRWDVKRKQPSCARLFWRHRIPHDFDTSASSRAAILLHPNPVSFLRLPTYGQAKKAIRRGRRDPAAAAPTAPNGDMQVHQGGHTDAVAHPNNTNAHTTTTITSATNTAAEPRSFAAPASSWRSLLTRSTVASIAEITNSTASTS